MSESILSRLRAESQGAHARLESIVQIDQRVKDVRLYRDLLAKFLGFYESMEALLIRLSGWPQTSSPLARRKSQWLVEDLKALGVADPMRLERCSVLPEVETLAQGFGCAYVLEGSTLGGRHIAGMLEQSPIPKKCRRFFRSYGPEVGERWKQFVADLERFAAEQGGHDQIVEAATRTFECLQEWLTEREQKSEAAA